MSTKIPFNKAYISPSTESYVLEAIRSGKHCGNHAWNQKCIDLLRNRFGFSNVFMVPSGTAALEMGVMLSGVGAGDEVIMPSYTFSSTATSALLNGATPIFCEIEPKSMNMDPAKLERLITSRTKLIVPIDYAGVPCDIDSINEIAKRYGIPVMVDAAQSMNSKDKNGRWVGTATELAAFSFHETKNFSCGEGGALVVNRVDWVKRAHFLQEKGTDRRLVLDGVKSKYGWVDKGSSYLMADILAAMLYAQLESIDEITYFRKKITEAYVNILEPFVRGNFISVQEILAGCEINHHAFFIVLKTDKDRQYFLGELKARYQIDAYIGYMPLHSSSKGLEMGYRSEDLPITQNMAGRIVRLPFYVDLGKSPKDLQYVVSSVSRVLHDMYVVA
jgi:dTDP-4-amino-4,6-dideoxygalactose transaminase